jgi:hypothetical protein
MELYTGAIGCFKCTEEYTFARMVYNPLLGVYVRTCEFRKPLTDSNNWVSIQENDPCDKVGYIFTPLTYNITDNPIDMTELYNATNQTDAFVCNEC